jgi:DNA polymerase I
VPSNKVSSYKEAEGVELLKLLYANPEHELALDTETRGLKVADGTDICIGVSIATVLGGKGYSHYYAVNHETGENVSEQTLKMLSYVLRQPRPLDFANVQFDILSLDTIGIHLDDSEFYDILTMANLINENQPKSKSLELLSKFYCSAEGKVKDPYVEAEKKSGNHNITPEQEFEYACVDAQLTWRVAQSIKSKQNWKELPEQIWVDKQGTIRVLLAMRRRGVLIDQPLAREMVARGEAEMKRLARELGYPAVPKKPTKMYPNPDQDPLPVLGPIALEDLFINRLNMPVIKRGKSGRPSFDKEVMEEYDLMLARMDSDEAKQVSAYRGWQKAVSAAYRSYLEYVDTDGRLRCGYKTHGTVTGRLSCAEPNLQQIPKESDKPWNGEVKKCFVAKPGYTLVNADFSQLELRLATAYAQEPELKKVFEEGRDIFTEMAEELGFSRQTTKTFVYSVQYGAGINRIMHAFGVSKPQAQAMLRKYAETYPKFRRLADYCDNKARNERRLKIWSGRYRHFQYESESYKAANSLIQGGAADIMEAVMRRVFRELDNPDCLTLLQVHDSLTFEVKTELVDEYIPRIKAMMEDVSGAIGHDEFDVVWGVSVELW